MKKKTDSIASVSQQYLQWQPSTQRKTGVSCSISWARQPAYHAPFNPPKNLIGFARFVEMVLGSLGGAVSPFAPYWLRQCRQPEPDDQSWQLTTCNQLEKVNVAHTRLPSVEFRRWSRLSAVSLQETWIINPTVGCHYFPPGLQLPPQPLRGLLPILLLGEQRHDGCEQFAKDCYPLAAVIWTQALLHLSPAR